MLLVAIIVDVMVAGGECGYRIVCYWWLLLLM